MTVKTSSGYIPIGAAFLLPNPSQLLRCLVFFGLFHILAMPLAWSQSTNPEPPDAAPQRPVATDVVATINGEPIRATQLDQGLRLRLHDLDRARYELRLQHLQRLIVRRVLGSQAAGDDAWQAALARANVRIHLKPPMPPRLDLQAGDHAIQGASTAPITLIVFGDFQSPHYRRAQPVLHRLLADYRGLLRLVVRDLPLPFHRHARQAAEAAACAREQDAYWPYHDLLLQRQDDLTPSALITYATALGLDVDRFRACVNEKVSRAMIDADIAAADRLGVHTVPTFFVNGLYLKGPGAYADMAWLINSEIERLGLTRPDAGEAAWRQASLSTLPLILLGTVVRQDAAQSVAVIRNTQTDATQRFKQGDHVLPQTVLTHIDQQRVYVRRGEQFEFLPLSTRSSAAAPDAPPPPPVPEPDAVMTLNRAEIEALLQDRQALEKKLTAGRLTLEGKRLLKLTDVEPGGLYARLGLRSRDVLMQVNGQWINDQQNPLWDALHTQRVVTVTIMRQGLPKTLQYVIDGAKASP